VCGYARKTNSLLCEEVSLTRQSISLVAQSLAASAGHAAVLVLIPDAMLASSCVPPRLFLFSETACLWWITQARERLPVPRGRLMWLAPPPGRWRLPSAISLVDLLRSGRFPSLWMALAHARPLLGKQASSREVGPHCYSTASCDILQARKMILRATWPYRRPQIRHF